MRVLATLALAIYALCGTCQAQLSQPKHIVAGILCDTQDEITAVVQSDDENVAVAQINNAEPHACAFLHEVEFERGQRAATVRTDHGLVDIVPLYVTMLDGTKLPGALQWSAFHSTLIEATWKPEYGQSPEAVQQWFRDAELTPTAKVRFPFTRCCEQAERLMTKFVAGDKADSWSYYPDPNCTHKGCELRPIPNDIVHEEAIHAIEPRDDGLPEFEAMRREGVLMIYQGQPTCFWPPLGGI